jgi:uncharacterized protein
MKLLVTGSGGLIGSELLPSLTGAGHEVLKLVRRPSGGPGEVRWDPDRGYVEALALTGVQGAIHLAGENIGARRWSQRHRMRVRESRRRGTLLLAKALSGLPEPPLVMISASAVGYYGNRGDKLLTEDDEPGNGFLPEVCREWEAATWASAGVGMRVVCLRFGMVLAKRGGALARMLPAFRCGLGGPFGNGHQYWSWITIEDVIGIVVRAISDSELFGPVNAVTPNPVTNAEFSRTLAGVLHRPAFLPVPAAVLRLALGDMADELLLASARVHPSRLLALGYEFIHPDLEGALRSLLKGAAR